MIGMKDLKLEAKAFMCKFTLYLGIYSDIGSLQMPQCHLIILSGTSLMKSPLTDSIKSGVTYSCFLYCDSSKCVLNVVFSFHFVTPIVHLLT